MAEQGKLTLEEMIRALKDDAYRSSLGPDKLAHVPDDPIGIVRLLDAQFNLQAEGATSALSFFTGTCGRVCQIITPEFGCDYVPACW